MGERAVEVGEKVWVCLDVLGVQQEDELIPGHEPMYVAAGTLRLGWSDDPTSDEFVTVAPYMVKRERPFVPVSPVRADREAVAEAVDQFRAWAIDGMCDMYEAAFPGAAESKREYREQLEMAFEARFPVLAALRATPEPERAG